MATVASVNALDVDSIVMPIALEQFKVMPSYLICELTNSPQLVKDVSGACCLARMGFKLYAYLTDQMKQDLCNYLCRQGLTVLPHTSPHCLVWGKIPWGLRMLERGLQQCRIAIVIIVAYNMKAPFADMFVFSSIQPPPCSVLSRFDLGRYCYVPVHSNIWKRRCVMQYLPNAGRIQWWIWQCGTELGAPTHSKPVNWSATQSWYITWRQEHWSRPTNYSEGYQSF